jgi:hypothetical protein
MPAKSILGGEVIVDSSYDVYEKPLPDSLKNSPDYQAYTWIGNFGLRVSGTKTAAPSKLSAKYEIKVVKRGNKQLVYWDGSKTVPFGEAHGKREVRENNQDYISVRLDLGDPPIGYGN